MNPAPQISVICAVYNRSTALRRTIDSVLTQTRTDWELILVDDGSTDDSAAVCRSYDDRRIQYHYQRNAGHSAARNTGLALAVGEYVAFLDHDDRWRPEKLERQAEYLEGHPDVVLVYARWERMDEEGECHGPGTARVVEGAALRDLLVHHNFVQSMSLPMMRTAMVKQVGGFRAEMDICDDLDLFIRLARRGPFGFIPEVLVDYNVDNERQQSRSLIRGVMSMHRCLDTHLRADTPFSPAETSGMRAEVRRWAAYEIRWFAWRSLRAGDLATARKAYALALRLMPGHLRDPSFLRDLGALARRSVRAVVLPPKGQLGK